MRCSISIFPTLQNFKGRLDLLTSLFPFDIKIHIYFSVCIERRTHARSGRYHRFVSLITLEISCDNPSETHNKYFSKIFGWWFFRTVVGVENLTFYYVMLSFIEVYDTNIKSMWPKQFFFVTL